MIWLAAIIALMAGEPFLAGMCVILGVFKGVA